MKFSICYNNNFDTLIDCIVIGIGESDVFFKFDECNKRKSKKYILKIIKYGDFQGKIGQILLLYKIPTMVDKRILLVGCGETNIINQSDYEKIIIVCIKKLIEMHVKNILCLLINCCVLNLNAYRKIKFFIETSKEIIQNDEFKNLNIFWIMRVIKNIILNIENLKHLKNAELALKHSNAIVKGIIRTKNLCNMPPNLCNAEYLSEKSKNLQLEYPDLLNTIIINQQEMKQLQMNAYLSVSYGSLNLPFMSIIKYNGNINNQKRPIVLIGKGVTFDSGGLSIKPSKNLDEMKYDMSGAASVFGIITTLSELRLPINVIGILAGCDNMIGKNSYRPGDIITTMSGKKVEVLNTDAEGRLILCDVLTYISRFNPLLVIDIATLTGACMVALGATYTGLMSNNKKLANDLIQSGNVSNDLVWQLPLHSDYENDLKSIVADLNNSDKGLAGASVAACFLSKFVKDYPWAHLDIAGTASSIYKNKGSTGRPNKLLCEYLLNQSKIFI
nr:leucyl aminopeptidase [Buchnera aphidicola]